MDEEIIKVDISGCLGFIKYLSQSPIEVILIQKFKMSFQIGISSSVYLNDLITKLILKKYTATLSEIINTVNATRYYKAIHNINSIIEKAILSGLKNPDIYGVEFKSMNQEDGKLYGTFKIFR
jgi:hypothetical protein